MLQGPRDPSSASAERTRDAQGHHLDGSGHGASAWGSPIAQVGMLPAAGLRASYQSDFRLQPCVQLVSPA